MTDLDTGPEVGGPGVTVRPASADTWDDLQAVFGTRGDAAHCYCQRYKLAPRESFGALGVDELRLRLRSQTGGDGPVEHTAGLVGYLDGVPAGWVAVQPRTAYRGLLRVYRIPWQGRDEDRSDPGVWSITCVFVRSGGYRRSGIGTALVEGAVSHAAANGARAVEAYPATSTNLIWGESHVGFPGMFEAAGLVEVSRPSHRRVVMRREL